MVTDDVKKLLKKLNDRLTRDLESAAGFAVNRSHYEVTLEHLLVKLLETNETDLALILNHFGVEPGRFEEALVHQLENFRTGNASRPSFSPTLLETVESAYLIGSVHHGFGSVRSGTLLDAMLRSDALKTKAYMDVLRPVGRDDLREHFLDIVAGSTESAARAPETAPPSRDGVPEEAEDSALAQFTVSFTQEARDGKIDPISGRNEEIRQITDILSRRRKNNPILVGEAGVGKTAIVEGLARRVANDDVPETLENIEIRSLDLSALKAGASVQGEFEDRLKSVLQEVREAAKPTILFIDEAHTLIGAGGGEGTGDAANLLKPALARGELRAIAATTWSEYKQYIEKDPALERRFQMVKIDEPSVEEAVVMLRGIRSAYEEHHGVQVTDHAVDAIAELAGRYISGRQLPDKAVDLLDTAAARVKMTLTARPGRLEDLDRQLQNLNTEIEGIQRDLEAGLREETGELQEVKQKREEVRAERDELEARWEREKELVERIVRKREELSTPAAVLADGQTENGQTEEQDVELDPETQEEIDALQDELEEVRGEMPMVHGAVDEHIAAEVVSDWTGIPVGNMLEDEAELLLNLEDRLGEHILGQDAAIREVSKTVRTSKASLSSPDSPQGVFLFVGPSGVGKTETALQLADLLFGGERFMTTINMSEYQEKHTAAQLKGSPPGYVGYGEGGVLTEAVRQRPYSVVLLDEIEKAHRDVMDLFYQVFDKGFMRDGEGREIDFRNTIIIMTSNLASDQITRLAQDTDERPPPDEVREAIHPTLVDHFQPALLGRMRVVPYYPLDTETMKGVTEIKLGEISDRLQDAHEIDFTYDPSIVDHIAARCTQVDAGARNVDFIINRTVLPEAAQAIIPRMTDDEMPSRLTLGLDQDGDFTYSFE
ncbi:MAG: type VI secretion system ATPase TssH [Salinibacter sp.]|uniref:type VI secretion system ATPase TssH n=1 Tax=Salinibacter sp. TaxID=2065818 RepID=UPI0035D4F838